MWCSTACWCSLTGREITWPKRSTKCARCPARAENDVLFLCFCFRLCPSFFGTYWLVRWREVMYRLKYERTIGIGYSTSRKDEGHKVKKGAATLVGGRSHKMVCIARSTKARPLSYVVDIPKRCGSSGLARHGQGRMWAQRKKAHVYGFFSC